MGRSFEVGTPIRVTRRNYTKNVVIRLHDCVFQYKSGLKTERYGFVQVVLLLPLTLAYQGMCYEVDLKYGGRETSEGSLVSCRSKDDMAGDGPLPSSSTKPTLYC